MSRYQKLLERVKIGGMELRNRIVMPPMTTNYAATDASVTDCLINYHAERARGGVGLQIIEAAVVDPLGVYGPVQLLINHPKYVPGFFKLTRVVHEYGGKCALQISHGGRQTYIRYTGAQIVAPSAIPCKLKGEIPRELAIEEIEYIEEAFGEAALRAKTAEFDAIEIQGAHGYLINQFLSPYSNNRMDKYGCDFEGRMIFALEVVEHVRKKVGKNFPIIFRMSGDEHVSGGLTIEDAKKIAERLEESGVDALHVSAANRDSSSSEGSISPMYVPHGHLIHLAEEIRRVVNVPIVAVGGITPEMAEDILRDRKADLISMGRTLIADPELPRKLAEGRPEDILRCIRCNDGCIGRLSKDQPMECGINAAVGREAEFKITPSSKPKRVLVVGGGPAGMEAARVAALRGHEVTLYEKKDKLGGRLIEASIPEFKADIRFLIEWLSAQMKKYNVRIELRKEATLDTVFELNPDVVIVATGGEINIPKINGVEKPITVTATDVLLCKASLKKEIVLAGGGSVGCETALFLAEKGKKVTVVEMLPDILVDVELTNKTVLTRKLAENNVVCLTNFRIEEITDKGIIAIDLKLEKHTIQADNVVLALGLKPSRKLYEALKGKVSELYMIGDCVKPRNIINSIQEGFQIALRI